MKTLNKKHDFTGLVDQQIFYENPYKDNQILQVSFYIFYFYFSRMPSNMTSHCRFLKPR
jgi:hypothetical protein